MKVFCIALFAIAALLGTPLSAQVYRSASGVGEAMILPYWTTSIGNDSLLSVRNDSGRAVAVKLLWLDEQGNVARSANLYLNGQSVWTGAATHSLDPFVIYELTANACLLPLALSEEAFSGVASFPLAAQRGSMEIIEMASVDLDSALAPAGRWIDCPALAERFSEGDWAMDPAAGLEPPAGRLSANNNLIDVNRGGMNTIEAIALGGFSDRVQHTLPDDPTPDLSFAVDSEAPSGGVRSLVCLDGQCRVDQWAVPVEAVAAVLMTSRVWTDYSVESALGALFDWVLHRPLDRYKSSVPGLDFGTEVQISIYSRRGAKYVFCRNGCAFLPTLPPGSLPPGTSDFPLDLEPFQHVLALSESTSIIGDPIEVSPLLGHPINLPYEVPRSEGEGVDSVSYTEGRSRLMFDVQTTPLTSTGGRVYVGEPVIAIGFQQFTNGFLQGGVLANYRGTEAPRYERAIQESD